jgi:hypothetical protein
MITTDCPNCGTAILAFARSCRRCGAPNRTRLGALAVAGALLLLIIAVAVTLVAMLRWQQTSTGDEFAWLEKAMEECDAEAETTPDTLRYLVVPMGSAPGEDAAWRAKSLNDVGNAILLSQRETLDGLRGESLRISTERYEFSVRDEATSAIYKWTPSLGVKKFLIPNAAKSVDFKVQFRTKERTSETEWGATFVHRAGTCYWVNAIIGR